MSDLGSFLRRWVTFAGAVLVIAVLYWAQAILVPLAIAMLLTFLLTPAVTAIERHTGRAPAVALVMLLAFSVFVGAGWGVARQLSAFADSLPDYRSNILQKVDDVRAAGRGGSVEKVQRTIEDLQQQIEEPAPGARAAREPVVVVPQQVSSLWGFPPWVGPLIEPLSTAGLVMVLVLFMLMERQDLRDRVIRVVGHGHLTSTTRAIDEAATRVSRYLLMQSLVNLTYGVTVAVGLYFIGVPYALLWGALGAVLRFIPYVGPLVAAGAPILVSLAVLPGWERPLYVIALFAGIELFTNMVLETLLYAGAAGVSQVGLLVAVAFWTWLWGPIGLLLATPLTVCLVVLGKHVAGLEVVATLMTDAPALTPDLRYYQRLLARDQAEAADILDEHLRKQEPLKVFDALMLPALNYAERDRLEGRLSPEEETAVIESTRDLIEEAAQRIAAGRQPGTGDEALVAAPPMPVLAYAANGEADALALQMLRTLVAGAPVAIDIVSSRMLASELVSRVTEKPVGVVCLADLPPSAPSKTRYLVRRLRAARPDLKIVVGRWAPDEFADDTLAPLRDAGTDHVGTTLLETRDYLRALARHRSASLPAA